MKNALTRLTALVVLAVCAEAGWTCESPGIYEPAIEITASINTNVTHYLCVGEEIPVTLSASDTDFIGPQNDVFIDTANLIARSGCQMNGSSGSCTISFESGGVHTWQISADDECLENNINDPQATLTLNFLVLEPDINADVNWDGNINGIDDQIEDVGPGLCIPLNDDDNANDTPDNQEPTYPNDPYPNDSDNDLVPVFLTYTPDDSYEPCEGGTITLAAGSGGGNIRVWVLDTSTTPSTLRRIALPKTYTVGNSEAPSQVAVEGYAAGEAELLLKYKLPDGSKECTDTLKLSIVKADLSAKGHDFNNPKSAGVTVTELQEEVPGAYIHFNCDNDDESSGGAPPKYPGGDHLQDDTVTGEDDLKQLTCALYPSALAEGKVVLARASDDVQVWKNATKGASNAILTGSTLSKTWDLANAAQRADFDAVKANLWVEGADVNATVLTLSFERGMRKLVEDTVNYTPIAATCGNQPDVSLRNQLNSEFPNLVDCEYSVTGPATGLYNCIAYSVDQTNVWYNPVDIGDGVEPITNAEIDAFYYLHKGWIGENYGPYYYEAMYYSGFHGARRRNCGCGDGRWCMYESKLGPNERIEHVMDQLDGSEYQTPIRFYRS